jgi:hypothetical protein
MKPDYFKSTWNMRGVSEVSRPFDIRYDSSREKRD